LAAFDLGEHVAIKSKRIVVIFDKPSSIMKPGEAMLYCKSVLNGSSD
jgi:hypothetical protein